MWGEKKQGAPTRTQQPQPQQPKQNSAPATPTISGSPISGEAKTMATLDSTYPATTPATSGGTARLGASLHVKGEITGIRSPDLSK